jgi:hypothetical protein
MKTGPLLQPLRVALQARKTALQRDIYKWSNMQAEHMPHIKWARNADDYTFSTIHSGILPVDSGFFVTANSADNNDVMDVDHIETVKLWMPSDIPTTIRHLVASIELISAEMELLQAELHDCLVSVRRFRRLHTVIRSNITGTWTAGADSAEQKKRRKQISDIVAKIETAKIRYQHAWTAADHLKPGGEWSVKYQWLDTRDIRGPNVSDDVSDLALASQRQRKTLQLGQGTYNMSWIWRTVIDHDEPEEAIRVQYAKTLANAERWEEEAMLIPEEMRQTLASFEYMARWWTSQIGRRPTSTQALQNALDAHARRQALIYQQRIKVFAIAWLPELCLANLSPVWASRYESYVPPWAWEVKRGNQRHRPGEFDRAFFFHAYSHSIQQMPYHRQICISRRRFLMYLRSNRHPPLRWTTLQRR